MENITGTIAVNLQAIRKEKQLTLQDLADLTGVSKSMLGEIERGASNPTITVLWKITTGLKIPISRLIHEQEPNNQLVRAEQWRPLQNKPNDISLIFECDHTRNFEVYHIEFQPGAIYRSNEHEKGVVEYTMVYEGEFTIALGEETFVLQKGDSFIFEGDKVHTYRNDGAVVTRAYSLIYYSFK